MSPKSLRRQLHASLSSTHSYYAHPPINTNHVHQQENMLQENTFWHDVTVNAYQSRRFAETGGDLDAVWASIRDSRDKV